MITTIPISIETDVAALTDGIIAIRGLLRYDGSRVEIEYQTSADSMKYSKAKTIGFDLTDVQRIDYRKGFFNSRITFHTTSITYFQGMPGADGEKLAVRIPRKYRVMARQLAWELQTTVEDRKLQRIPENP